MRASWRDYVRPAAARLEPYTWEISSEEVAARYGMPADSVLRYDTNTSPFPPINLSSTLAALAERMPLNEYPDTSYRELVETISAYTGFPAEQIVVGCGADEVLDLIAKVFVEAGTRAVIGRPSYAMYPVLTATNGGLVTVVADGQGFARDLPALIAVARDAGIVWLCNPNNPTGNLMPLADLERLVGEIACPVVVDEAYFEFSGVTAAGLIERYPQVIAVRTLSKAFSLAGLRVGYALAAVDMAEQINRVRPPNSVGTLSVALAAAALRDLDTMRERVRLTLAERERFSERLRSLGAEVFPTATNFLLIRVAAAAQLVESLLRAGIVVRDLSARPGLEGCLRVTVRLPEENDRFLEAIAATV